MANVKFVAVSRGLSGIVDYVTNREKTTDKLITGVNCVARTAVHEFEAVKKQFHKTDGRAYSDMDENSMQQEIVDDPYAIYDEEPAEELEEEQDMEYQQYHGFGFGGMGGMSM